ncbi:MAG TPA: TIGR03619 family F420-dependent LLM class oxidoreductase [Pseudonocardia sp.]|jgi:probable F420-dependent oxidoreductase|nr:TIGR03619 family F420-dependent LLM class oxidoreductase [Pseudonocardia sp.]
MTLPIGIQAFLTDHTVDVVSIATEAEARGLDSLWLGEHSHMPVGSQHPATGAGRLPESYRRFVDPYIALAAAGAATTRLRIGTSTGLPAEHHPLQMAKQVASLDHVSAGRFDFGVGYGWNELEMRNLGVDFSRRRAIVREKMRAMNALWTEEVASFDGEFVRFSESWAWPKPVQKPRPPVLVGGPPKDWVLNDILEFADGWLPILPIDLAELTATVSRLRARFASSPRAAVRPQVTALDLQAGVRSRSADDFAAALPNRAALDDLGSAGVDRLVLTVPVTDLDLMRKTMDLVAALTR